MWRYLCPLKYLHGPIACGGGGGGGGTQQKREGGGGEGGEGGRMYVCSSIVGIITLQRVPELA